MICKKCKKQIDDDSKFCEFCGSKIDIKENRSDEYNKKIKELEEKAWFRILKVAYVLLFITGTVFGVLWIYNNNYPAEKYPNLSESKIECLGGNRKTFSLWDADVLPRINQVNGSHSWSDWELNRIEKLCEYKYYSVKFHTYLVTETKGGIKTTILYSVSYVIGIVALYKIVKIIFFYIVLGGKKTKKLKK